ncbi:MAG TPA: glycosyltransferase family 4 protein [Solirubrobacteraceae bacterium]|jgi:glycosyltransferase involved in cell wall biosynthesis|nr:glycosyltransferase family 4 protein [Solirubrobacteraceae bacterium]
MKPVLFVTGHAPPYRVGAFAALHERENVEFALFGGRLAHGGGATATELPFPHRQLHEHALKGAPHGGAHPEGRTLWGAGRQAGELYALAASGRYRAVVCSTGGRVGLLATWAGARRARVPLLLWASLWAHPRSFAHAFSFVALRRLYRSADALVTYGPHVSAYVRAYGARNVHVAPQAVDNAFWSSAPSTHPTSPAWPNESEVKFLFAGRPTREKGLGVLAEAWSMSGLQAPTAALVLVGAGPTPPWVPAGGAVVGAEPMPASAVVGIERVPAAELRDLYAAADVLVVPSIATRTFREPWGLVVNEAMNQGLPVIASDAVGAAAGGLVRDEHNGVIVPASDPIALAAALRRLAGDAAMRARMGTAGKQDVAAYNFDAWSGGFSAALASVGVSREGVR